MKCLFNNKIKKFLFKNNLKFNLQYKILILFLINKNNSINKLRMIY